MSKFPVTLALIREKGLNYLNQNMLGAQVHLGVGCRYIYSDGCRCIVGTTLPDEFENWLEDQDDPDDINNKGYFNLLTDEVFETPREEQYAIIAIQLFHDSWSRGSMVHEVFLNPNRDWPEWLANWYTENRELKLDTNVFRTLLESIPCPN